MIYVGIDITKLNHFASAIPSGGKVLFEPFKFTNDADGFQLLSSHLDSLPDNSFIIGLELMTHYGDNLVSIRARLFIAGLLFSFRFIFIISMYVIFMNKQIHSIIILFILKALCSSKHE